MAEADRTNARRYLLDELSEAEREALEQAYLRDETIADGIAEAEDALIEDYLDEALDARERERFVQAYLSTPEHRARVDTIRRLRTEAKAVRARTVSNTGASGSEHAPRRGLLPWLVLAAAVVLLTTGTIAWLLLQRIEQSTPKWSSSPSSSQQANADEPKPPSGTTPTPPATTPETPRVFAVTLSPISVRGAGDASTIVIPADADTVSVRLEGESTPEIVANWRDPRAAVRTATGDEVWRGPAVVDGTLAPGILARVDVPAVRLHADDYIVDLLGTDARGGEDSRGRYVLRVRVR